MSNDFVTNDIATLLKQYGYEGTIHGFMKTINWYSGLSSIEEAKEPKNWKSHTEFTYHDEKDWEQTLDNGAVKKCTYIPVIHLYDAQKWLRDTERALVLVDYDSTENKYWSNINYLNSVRVAKFTTGKSCNTYEEALNEGMKEVLKLI